MLVSAKFMLFCWRFILLLSLPSLYLCHIFDRLVPLFSLLEVITVNILFELISVGEIHNIGLIDFFEGHRTLYFLFF